MYLRRKYRFHISSILVFILLAFFNANVINRPKTVGVYRDCPHEKTQFIPTWCPQRLDPVEPWAFIRAKNEIVTAKSSLDSIIPVIKKGVIVISNSTDGTAQILEEFVQNNPGYKLYYYPHHVIEPLDIINYDKPHNFNNTLAALYNFAASKIPLNDWLIKIDLDHIYDIQKLRDLMRLPKYDDDVVCLTRFNLIYKYNSKSIEVNSRNPYNPYCDHWLLKKKRDFVFDNIVEIEEGRRYYHEDVKYYYFNSSSYSNYYTEVSSWHFFCLKIGRSNCSGLGYKDFLNTSFDRTFLNEYITDEFIINRTILTLNFSYYITKNLLKL